MRNIIPLAVLLALASALGCLPAAVEVVVPEEASPPVPDDDDGVPGGGFDENDDLPDHNDNGDGDGGDGDTSVPSEPRRFIGAPCHLEDGCLQGGVCLDVAEGFPDGHCSLACQRLCPDDVDAPSTFCVDDVSGGDGGGGDGICVSQCVRDGDCRPGYGCVEAGRHGEAGTRRTVCWPTALPLPAESPATNPPTDSDDDDDDDDATCTSTDFPLDNAGLSEAPGIAGCPPGMTRLAGNGGGFCMDRFEAFLEIVIDGALRPFSPHAHPDAGILVARSAAGAIPQGHISGTQAADACANAGKRLCTEGEWVRACGGVDNTLYPWGNTARPGRCNDARSRHPAIEYFGTSADWIWSELDHPCLNQLPASLASTGSHPACVTSDGIYDLMGNLHEWTADPAGTFRGGFYVDTARNGPGCRYRTTAHTIGHWDYSTGFRCCAD